MTDHLGRTGGDEFLALLPGTDASRAERISQRIVDAVGGLEVSMAPGRRFDISVGWASTSEERLPAESLMAVADRRLYDHREELLRLATG